MTDESPFDTARKIRAYGEALAQQDILAREIEYDASRLNLPQAAAAETFFRRSNGAPRCEHQTQADHQTPPCPEDAALLVTNFSGATVGDAFAEPTAPSLMTRAYCQQHAAENAVNHHGWLHSAPLADADQHVKLQQLQLARRLIRNFHSTNPAPYPNPGESDTPSDIPSDIPSVARLRQIQSKITFLLRPARICAAPLCYDAASQR